jgi:hypothetical protein
MYDTGKILTGLVIFIGLVTAPFWFGMGSSDEAPKPTVLTAKGDKCIESAAFMRANHMQILDTWRDDVVRNNDRIHKSVEHDGLTFDKSLSNTCMDCHSNKAEFCDSCHEYSSVRPYCWECHVEPKETN